MKLFARLFTPVVNRRRERKSRRMEAETLRLAKVQAFMNMSDEVYNRHVQDIMDARHQGWPKNVRVMEISPLGEITGASHPAGMVDFIGFDL